MPYIVLATISIVITRHLVLTVGDHAAISFIIINFPESKAGRPISPKPQGPRREPGPSQFLRRDRSPRCGDFDGLLTKDDMYISVLRFPLKLHIIHGAGDKANRVGLLRTGARPGNCPKSGGSVIHPPHSRVDAVIGNRKAKAFAWKEPNTWFH